MNEEDSERDHATLVQETPKYVLAEPLSLHAPVLF